MSPLVVTPDLTLYQALQKVIAAFPDRPALVFGEVHLTYRELGGRVDALAQELRAHGVRRGDKVALILSNSVDFVCGFFAPAALGAVMVPVNPAFRQKEIQHILSESEACVVVAEPKPMGNDVRAILEAACPSLPSLRHILWRGAGGNGPASPGQPPDAASPLPPDTLSPDDLCALVYTSGTTGVPKAVMHSHRTMLMPVFQGSTTLNLPLLQLIKRAIQLTFRYDARFLRWGTKQYSIMSPSPMHALLGYSALIYGLMYGFRVVISDRFHPARVLELIEREHVNALIAAPTMVAALLSSADFAKRNHSSLLYVLMGAAPCPPELVKKAREAFGCPIMIAFGTTELGGSTLMTNFADSEALQLETVGRVFPGMQVKIVDEQRREVPRGEVGELAQRLGSAMLGYYKADELTAQVIDADGWCYTGDLATMDERDYIRIVGRKKDMIIRGGQNVFPAEIENHLLGRRGILHAAVVGVPDALAGERVWAFVVPQPGAAITAADVQAYCRGELAAYKVPDQVRIVEALPMTSTGKAQKFRLREVALEELRAASEGQPPPGIRTA